MENSTVRFLLITSLSLLVLGCNSSGGDSVPVANRVPISSAGPDQKFVVNSGEVLLDGSLSVDPDSDSLKYQWSFLQVPGDTPTLNNTLTASTSFTPVADVTGTYRLMLTVSDGLYTDVDIVDIDVAVNTTLVPDAGADRRVARADTLQLFATSSYIMNDPNAANNGPNDAAFVYRWTQLSNACPDATGGTGAREGKQLNLTVPTQICTLAFDLRIDDGSGFSFADRVYIHIVEDPNQVLFVDGMHGNDTSPGTMAEPLLSLQLAINTSSLFGQGADIYVSKGKHTIDRLELAEGVSLYGGYNETWERDPSIYKTRLVSEDVAVIGDGVGNFSIDGFTISSSASATGNSITLQLSNGNNVAIANNVIESAVAKVGGNGSDGERGTKGLKGFNGIGGSCDRGHGVGGLGGEGGFAGGLGGSGGPEGANNGESGMVGEGLFGGLGGAGGTGGSSGQHAASGTNGGFGVVGDSGLVAPDVGVFDQFGYTFSVATNGSNGASGSGGGGGGGGGGQGGLFKNDGGGNGGGGGGGGGYGGSGGQGGDSGSASIAIYLYAMGTMTIKKNTVITRAGGDGGSGGAGGLGGTGGDGGIGANNCSGSVGVGGNGGAGGAGGNGGFGGGGSGGPSIGIVYDAANPVTLSGNTFKIGYGGSGGSPNGLIGRSETTFEY